MAKKGTTKYKSNLQEKRVAKELGGRRVIASGSLWFASSDVRHDNLLVECKTTDKDYYSLSLATWEKIEKEAVRDGLRIPVMCIDIKGGEESYAVFLENHFKHYKRYYNLNDDVETSWTDKKSFRVNEPKRILMLTARNKSGETPCFIVTPWADFLYLLKGGETDE